MFTWQGIRFICNVANDIPFVAGSKNLNASTLYQNLSLVMKMDAQWFIDLVNFDLVDCRDLVQYVNLATEMVKSYHRDDST